MLKNPLNNFFLNNIIISLLFYSIASDLIIRSPKDLQSQFISKKKNI